MTRLSATLLLLAVSLAPIAYAEIKAAPDRDRGEGPFEQLILRGGILVNGAGAPPIGPVDIVIENKRIAEIAMVGAPGVDKQRSRNRHRRAVRAARVRRYARTHRRQGPGHAGRVCLQAVAGSRHHDNPRSGIGQWSRLDDERAQAQ